MNRSGYSEEFDPFKAGRWQLAVERAIRGKRGQAFLRELAKAMDEMPEKVLIADELIDNDGYCCAIGVVCQARGVDVSTVDYEDARSVAKAVGIARAMAAEIEFENDFDCRRETPEQRWKRMRLWVDKHLTHGERE
jgi:hypothetical protein